MAVCMVSDLDTEGLRHSVEVQADSLYEAAVLAMRAFKAHDCEQLADEMNYRPEYPRTYAASLEQRSTKYREAQSEGLRQAAQAKEFRAKYSQMEAEQQAIIDNFDPYRTPIEVVSLARQTVETARLYLTRIPEGDQPSLDEQSPNAERRAERVLRLKAWLDRLRFELRRINNEIKALTGPAADPRKKSALEDDLKAITEAILHVHENLRAESRFGTDSLQHTNHADSKPRDP